jgi:hypothetical protein
MSELEELLNERLEQLETGAPLEVCLAGLPKVEAELLQLATLLREMPYPARSHTVVTAQRAALLRIAAKEKNMKTQSSPRPEKRLLDVLSGWFKPVNALPAATAILLILVAAGIIWSGFLRGTAQNAGIARDATPETIAGASPVQELAPTLAATAEPGPRSTPAPGESGAVSPGQEPTPEAIAAAPTHSAFLPVLSVPLVPNPQSATVKETRGLVEVQAADGAWIAVASGHTLQAGGRIRTGELSGATLAFYDGSEATLAANTEVSVDELDAQLGDGPRLVALTQWLGETDHEVAPATNDGSRYEVRTPSATGEAKGTSFHVSVTPDLLTRFSVAEGSVAVTSINVTVVVVAGQVTIINAGQAPSEPVFYITGEGRVTQIGAVWTIAGQTFQTHEQTVVVGNPGLNDIVFVEGRLLADGTRLADYIVLLRHWPVNRFTITGDVEVMGSTAWSIAGQAVMLNDGTQIEEGIALGDFVGVEGIIQEDGTLLAERIYLIGEGPGLPFHFMGVVQAITAETWRIAGIEIAVAAQTEIDPTLAVGDVAVVHGRILENGAWLARSIRRVAQEESTFAFTGRVQRIDPWMVAGIAFETRNWTQIEPGIVVGDWVRVSGRILADGTWLAADVDLLEDDDDGHRVVFFGRVVSIDPWVVGGIPLVVNSETSIGGNIEVGLIVRVEAEILPDGTWLARKIRRVGLGVGLGCMFIHGKVMTINGNQIVLDNWPILVLDDSIQVIGEIAPDVVIRFYGCFRGDGTIIIVNIIVIYVPIVIIIPPPPLPPDDDDQGGQVTICHKTGHGEHTITVPRSALQGHLNHGDTIGGCPRGGGGGGDNDDDDD